MKIASPDCAVVNVDILYVHQRSDADVSSLLLQLFWSSQSPRAAAASSLSRKRVAVFVALAARHSSSSFSSRPRLLPPPSPVARDQQQLHIAFAYTLHHRRPLSGMPPRSSTKRKATTAPAPESDVDEEQQQKPQRKGKGKGKAPVKAGTASDNDDDDDEEAASSSKAKKPKKAAAAKEPVKPLDASLPVNTTFPIELKLDSKAEGTTRLSCWNGALSSCSAARVRSTDFLESLVVCGLNSCLKKVRTKCTSARSAP